MLACWLVCGVAESRRQDGVQVMGGVYVCGSILGLLFCCCDVVLWTGTTGRTGYKWAWLRVSGQLGETSKSKAGQ